RPDDGTIAARTTGCSGKNEQGNPRRIPKPRFCRNLREPRPLPGLPPTNPKPQPPQTRRLGCRCFFHGCRAKNQVQVRPLLFPHLSGRAPLRGRGKDQKFGEPGHRAGKPAGILETPRNGDLPGGGPYERLPIPDSRAPGRAGPDQPPLQQRGTHHQSHASQKSGSHQVRPRGSGPGRLKFLLKKSGITYLILSSCSVECFFLFRPSPLRPPSVTYLG